MSNRKLSKDIASMGAANGLDYLLQFILPIIVARALSTEDFAGYRMVWMVIATLMAFVTLQIPQNLSYFLPRLSSSDKSRYVSSALFVMGFLSTLGATLVNPWFPFIPLEIGELGGHAWFFSIFIFFWGVGTLIDWLPVSDGRAPWQAKIILFLSFSRVLLVCGTAWFTNSLHAVLIILIAYAVLKVAILIFYMGKFNRFNFENLGEPTKTQLNYTWSFGIASGLYELRHQAALWIVAAAFSAREFAAFSLGGVATPLFGLIRKSVNNVVFPNLSFLAAKDDLKQVCELNKKTTSTVAFILVPIATCLWLLSKQVITIVYTEQYEAAGDVMRIFLIGVIPQVFESSTLLRLANLGRTALAIDFLMLLLVVIVSYFGAQLFGLAGGALGGVTALILGHFIAVRKGSRKLGVSVFQLYNFSELGWIFLISILSAVCSYFGMTLTGIKGALLQIFVGGSLFLVSYLVLMVGLKKVPLPLAKMIRRA